MSTHRIRSRSGMTLIEVLVALLVGLMVMQTALVFFGQQGRAFGRGTTAMNALQNGRFAVNSLEKDVRTLGVGLMPRQPGLIYAGPDVIAFNADYASSHAADTEAVYVDESLPPAQAEAVKRASRFLIPMTAVSYPDSNYYSGDSNAPAETLTFFFQPDATTPRTDDFVLYRQVNAAAPAVVARNLLQTPGTTFFEYFAVRVPVDAATRMESLGGGPLRHTAPLHGSPQDTTRADSVRAVRVRFTVTNGVTGAQEQKRPMERMIRMPNAGVAMRKICGNPPLGTSLGARYVLLPDGSPAVQLTWNASVDESSGEGDVLRYILWKRVLPNDFGDSWISIPAVLGPYSHVDAAVSPGQTVQYQLAAQDCTPSRSPTAVSSAVAIPALP